MASEDSHSLNAVINCASLRRRFPPRFIGALNARISSNPSTVRCRPERTSEVICRSLYVLLSTDWDVEASLSVDEARDPVSQVRDSIHPVR